MENIDIRLTYESVFSNMLQINVAIRNHNTSPLVLESNVRLQSTCKVSEQYFFCHFVCYEEVQCGEGIKMFWKL